MYVIQVVILQSFIRSYNLINFNCKLFQDENVEYTIGEEESESEDNEEISDSNEEDDNDEEIVSDFVYSEEGEEEELEDIEVLQIILYIYTYNIYI